MHNLHRHENKLLIVVGGFLLIIFCMGGYLLYVNNALQEKIAIKKSRSLNSTYTTPTPKSDLKTNLSNSMVFADQQILDNKLLLVVGDENIFYKDYSIEILNIAQDREPDNAMKKQALQKLVNDSTIIQYSISKGYIKPPDMTLYNSPDKQYPQRLDLIMQCEDKISTKEFKKIAGEGLKITFLNIQSEKLSLSDGKEIIRKKIVNLYADIKDRKKSNEEAVAELTMSPEFSKMTKLDIVPTPFEFDTMANKKITDSEVFDGLIWETPQGSITPIFHDAEPGDKDAYLFAFINTRTDTGYNSMEDFYNKNTNLYDVTIY